MRYLYLTSDSDQTPIEVRVVTTTTIGFVDPRVDESVRWQGVDLDELSLEFPPSDIMFADELGIKEDLEDGWIRFRTRFERLLPNGSWEEIDDPRRRLTPMTDLEREIDADNRRRFPGDYMSDDDCERCGGYGCPECDSSYYEEHYYCDDCHDAGCKECEESYDCESCHDYGCERCEPGKWCALCGHSLEASETELCASCTEYCAPRCDNCGKKLTDEESDLCAQCKLDDERWDAYDDSDFCHLCGRILSSQENLICTECHEAEERELEATYAQYKEWWISPEDSRLQRTISWLRWTLYRITHRH